MFIEFCDFGVAGGDSVADNCQILQTRVNRFKSDKDNVDKAQLQGYSCDVKFTGIHASFPFRHSFKTSFRIYLIIMP